MGAKPKYDAAAAARALLDAARGAAVCEHQGYWSPAKKRAREAEARAEQEQRVALWNALGGMAEHQNLKDVFQQALDLKGRQKDAFEVKNARVKRLEHDKAAAHLDVLTAERWAIYHRMQMLESSVGLTALDNDIFDMETIKKSVDDGAKFIKSLSLPLPSLGPHDRRDRRVPEWE
jgi:hypothetical protein